MSVITELDNQLASLNQLKPPGASKSKIQSITLLCVTNIQAESNLVQSLYSALKKAPATHKLGAIYVIDSVVRRWIEQAKSKGQELNFDGRGEPGTFSAAVKRVTELMPALFDDIIKVIPAEQKEKLGGMLKIWEKGGTFPPKLLADMHAKMSAPVKDKETATGKFVATLPSRPLYTPIGYPPAYLYTAGLMPPRDGAQQTNGGMAEQAQPQHQNMKAPTPAPVPFKPPPTQDVNSILASLASLKPAQPPQPAVQAQQAPPPPQQQAQQQPAPPQLPPNIASLLGQQGMNGQQSPYPANFPPPAGPYSVQGFSPFPPQQPPSVAQQYAQAPPPPQQMAPQQQSDPLGPLRHILPANILNDPQKLVPALNLLQDLQRDNIPMDQWAPVLQAFEQQYQPPPQQAQQQYGNQAQGGGRARSRSPDRGGRRGGRGSPVYGSYDGNQPGDGGRGRYRQRSPMREAPGQGSEYANNNQPMQPKMIDYDNGLPSEHIKVLSRTLFVGGANGSQQDIQQLFEQFGRVQTCIANQDKRHAFVKMTTRAHALTAKAGMEKLQAQNDRYVNQVARQTKWGVGFGPRECCDYQRGESVIPIWKLTEADMKWLLTAEYGGTGGRKVESGMVLEEPDIEIGAGVSSKAMSKRHPNDPVNHNGGARKQRDDGSHGGQRRDKKRYFDGGQQQQQQQGGQQQGGQQQYGYSGVTGGQQMEAYGYARPEPVAVATPPAVPGFGFGLPGTGRGF